MPLSIAEAIDIQQKQLKNYKVILKPKVFKLLGIVLDISTKQKIAEMKKAKKNSSYYEIWKNRESTEYGNPKTGYQIPRGGSIDNLLKDIKRALNIKDWVKSDEAKWERNKPIAAAIRAKRV